jgi:hypothetical protein
MLTHVQLSVDIDESDVDGLMPGEPVTFEVESYPDDVFHGSIRELRLQPVAQQTATTTAVAGSTGSPASGVVTTVVSYTAIIDVANPDQRLRPGMTATASIITAAVKAVPEKQVGYSGLMVPVMAFPFQSSTMNRSLPCTVFPAHVPIHDPFSGWPSWAWIGAASTVASITTADRVRLLSIRSSLSFLLRLSAVGHLYVGLSH